MFYIVIAVDENKEDFLHFHFLFSSILVFLSESEFFAFQGPIEWDDENKTGNGREEAAFTERMQSQSFVFLVEH